MNPPLNANTPIPELIARATRGRWQCGNVQGVLTSQTVKAWLARNLAPALDLDLNLQAA